MKLDLLPWLRCPVCGCEVRVEVFASDPISGEIQEGILYCEQHAYPLTKGIPRMLAFAFELFPEFVARFRGPLERWAGALKKQGIEGRGEARMAKIVREQFERQWHWWGKQKRLYGRTQDEMTRMIRDGYAVPALMHGGIEGKRVLDAGCGHGGFTKAFADCGAVVVGLEYGLGVECARERCQSNPKAHFVQGDILHPPFARDTFDIVFCHGVLSFLQDSFGGFRRLVDLARPGGYIRLWLYPKGGFAWELIQNSLRAVLSRLPPRLLYYLCFVPVPLLRWVRTYSGTHRGNSSWNECAQVVWDYYSSPTQAHHTSEEVLEWYRSCNCHDVILVHMPLSLVGVKGRGAHENPSPKGATE